MHLTDVASELYGLTLDEFTVARNAAARDAAPEVAPQVRALRKPTASAWLVNMLVRHRADEIDSVLGLGEQLRDAQAGFDANELRTLGRQRTQLLASVTEHARVVAGDLGQSASPSTLREVEQTLQAAMIDTLAAAVVRTGCLVHAISASGLEPADLTDAVAVPAAVTALVKDAATNASLSDLDAAKSGAGAGAGLGPGSGSGSGSGDGSVTRSHSAFDSASSRVPSESDRKNAQRLQEARRVADEAETRARQAAVARQAIEAELKALGAERVTLETRLSMLAAQVTALEREQSALVDSITGLDRRVRNLTRDRDKAERLGSEARSAADRARERWRLLS